MTFSLRSRRTAVFALSASFAAYPLALLIWGRLQASILTQSSPSADRISRAIQLDPANDLYPILLAQRAEESALPSLPLWRSALALNPRRDLSLTQAAVAAEIGGDPASAEQLFLQAARFNQLWLPRWSLASFYARHNRPRDLFHWARLALLRAYTDQRPVFLLCLDAGASPASLLDEIVPHRPENLGPFLYFLIERNSLDLLPRASTLYLSSARAAALPPSIAHPVLASATAALIPTQPAAAAQLWNAFSPHPRSPQSPLVNPTFDSPLSPAAFDWEILAHPGIDPAPGIPTAGIKFIFSGSQPESAPLLRQYLLLSGGRPWTLSLSFQSRGIAPAQAGLSLTLTPLGASGPLPNLAPPPALSADDWTPANFSWQLPPGDAVYLLQLSYHRPHGQVRTEGELFLRDLSLSSGAPRP